jgi:hypothetical protein
MYGRFDNPFKLTHIMCFHQREREPVLPSFDHVISSIKIWVYLSTQINTLEYKQKFIYLQSGDVVSLATITYVLLIVMSYWA